VLLRDGDGDVLAIGQQSHAWISGQLARAWGNDRFPAPEPWEEVCLAAEQHDAGWRTLDLEPSYNPDTGLPHGFTETPLEVHLELWTEGPRSLVSQSRYAALLASMHGWRLYERRDLSRLPATQAAAVRRFLGEQKAFQERLCDSLRPDENQLRRNSLLLWTWDYLSLALCLGWSTATAEGAPSADGLLDIDLTAGSGDVAHLDPWPFAGDAVTVSAEGRRLPGRFEDERQMRAGLAAARWETLELRLEPRPAQLS
jgi:Protein of unknown function (DUF3891)